SLQLKHRCPNRLSRADLYSNARDRALASNRHGRHSESRHQEYVERSRLLSKSRVFRLSAHLPRRDLRKSVLERALAKEPNRGQAAACRVESSFANRCRSFPIKIHLTAHACVQAAVDTGIIEVPEVRARLIHKLFLTTEENHLCSHRHFP